MVTGKTQTALFKPSKSGLSKSSTVNPISNKVHALEQTVPVIKLSSISTGQLNLLLNLHTRPINLLVSKGTLEINSTKSYLGDDFTLICFQRLSVPQLAIRPCSEQNNRNTRAAYL